MEERKQLLDHSMTNCNSKKVTKLANDYQNHEIKSESKKGPTFKNWPLVKNPHFLYNPNETW